MLLTLKLGQNIVYGVTNVEQRKLLRFELTRNSRRCVQPFLLNPCCCEENRACLPGPLCNSGRNEVTVSVQAARWTGTWNCSRNPNLAPNSNSIEPPTSTSRADPRENLKRNPPLVPNTVPFVAEKGHWTKKGCEEPYGTRGQTVLRPIAYDDL